MIDPVGRAVFSDFYDLVRPPKPRKKEKCLKCGARTIGCRICNKCKKFVNNQSKMAQDGGFSTLA